MAKKRFDAVSFDQVMDGINCWLDDENGDKSNLHDLDASDSENEDFSISVDARRRGIISCRRSPKSAW